MLHELRGWPAPMGSAAMTASRQTANERVDIAVGTALAAAHGGAFSLLSFINVG